MYIFSLTELCNILLSSFESIDNQEVVLAIPIRDTEKKTLTVWTNNIAQRRGLRFFRGDGEATEVTLYSETVDEEPPDTSVQVLCSFKVNWFPFNEFDLKKVATPFMIGTNDSLRRIIQEIELRKMQDGGFTFMQKKRGYA